MNTTQFAQARLKFAVRLAQIDLSALRQGDLLTLRGELQNFFIEVGAEMSVRGPLIMPLADPADPLPADYTTDDFAALQRDVQSMLNSLVDGRTGESRSFPTMPISVRIAALPFGTGAVRLSGQGPTRDSFLLLLWILLGDEPNHAIQRCPECQDLFYRVRKQRFCSARCTNRAYMRGYREDEAIRAKEADASHARYGKRLTKNGIKGKPARRPRRTTKRSTR